MKFSLFLINFKYFYFITSHLKISLDSILYWYGSFCTFNQFKHYFSMHSSYILSDKFFFPLSSNSYLPFLIIFYFSTCFHKGPRTTESQSMPMVFKSTSEFSTFVYVLLIQQAHVLYIYIVSLLFTLLLFSTELLFLSPTLR